MNPTDVACPKCGSGAGKKCRSLTTNRSTDTHEARFQAAYGPRLERMRWENEPGAESEDGKPRRA